ncbi:MAG: N-ethylammeline chlorohydrolase [Paenibacillus sp.]|jgi:imidazolonepropionase-like amidohydrolase|nr:N-ethylammeline chlorohydrolase [Paenibacillus sp.]
MGSTLIKQAQLVTMNDRNEVLTGDLLIENDRIAGIGPEIKTAADRVIDGRGKVVLPGFVQTHIHGSARSDSYGCTQGSSYSDNRRSQGVGDGHGNREFGAGEKGGSSNDGFERFPFLSFL